jgi:hypothetical protein
MAMDECDGLNECTRKCQINKKSDIMPPNLLKKRQWRFASLELTAGFGSAVSFTRKNFYVKHRSYADAKSLYQRKC